jgi:hypothetical protein
MREWLGAADVPLLITEGAKKGDAATTVRLCCASLLGVKSWRGRNDKDGLTALAEWNDSDAWRRDARAWHALQRNSKSVARGSVVRLAGVEPAASCSAGMR